MSPDLYKYFRVEARELIAGLTEAVLQLERGTDRPTVIARALRLAHTLKGAARVVRRTEIADLAHTIEDKLTAWRDASGEVTQVQATEVLHLLDEAGSHLRSIEVSAQAPPGSVRPPVEEQIETVRVDVREMDALLRGIAETSVQLESLRAQVAAKEQLVTQVARVLGQLATGATDDAKAPAEVRVLRGVGAELQDKLERFPHDLGAALERVERELAQVRDAAHCLRLVPAHSVFPALERTVRDAAQAVAKQVDFVTSGGDVQLDAGVLALTRDALMHVVRNAVTHGVESERDRVKAGKPLRGHIRLDVERRGTRVAFVCTDDGRGIDVDAVRDAAVVRGHLSPGRARELSADDVIGVLAQGGISTTTDVTELAGRGIGLDVVRATAARLKGHTSLRSRPGHGVTAEFEVPISVASLAVLRVESGGRIASFPFDAVRRALWVRDTDVVSTADRSTILCDGSAIPFAPLTHLLPRSRGTAHEGHNGAAVVVQAGEQCVAIGVERLVSTSRVVMRQLPSIVQADAIVLGAFLDGEGNPQLVLDPHGLVAAAARVVGPTGGASASPLEQAPVLVIDDSLTTRMLEQSILQSAGYPVEVAVSAEEALEKAATRRYSLFIVDVEMPGMSGFEFLAKTRSDSALREIPAILMTSRNAEEDRRRGAEVGARAYMVKSEFDQGLLLRTISRLIGR